MTLAEVVLPISDAWGKSHALLFRPELAGRLAQLHAQYGSTNCVPDPRSLTDGRLMLCADILIEVRPGGLLQAMWEEADKNVLLPAVEVVPMAEAVSLLPQETPPA